MQLFARAGQQDRGDGHGDRDPERFGQHDGAEQIGDHIAERRHDGAVEPGVGFLAGLGLGTLLGEALPVPDRQPGAEHRQPAQIEQRRFGRQRIEQRAGKGQKRKGAHAARRLQAAAAQIFLPGQAQKEGEAKQRQQALGRQQRIGHGGEEGFGRVGHGGLRLRRCRMSAAPVRRA